MSERYEHDPIELKWQKRWEEAHCNEAKTDYTKPKFYGLIEFPYPSGQGLHVGHPRPFTAMDVICRKRRLEGYNVLFPMGYDAFGLPTENYAIKTGIHPAKVTETNIARFRAQLKRLGYSFDWSREISTADPEYYKWTQWIFLKLYEHGLAYKAEIPINFCTSCKVGLANEEVVDGVCERCGGQVIQMVRSQWMLKITEYAQKLIDDLDKVDYIERVKTQQRNWIGRSEGAEVDFIIANTDDKLTVYTTRPDTLFGATYMVISPEHPYIDKYKDRIANWDAVAKYREEAAHKSDFERGELNKEKTGVVLEGVSAINPVTKKEIPIWVSDYVLMSYGTGAIMAVPAHDTRDYEFAKTFNLPIVEVVAGGDVSKEAYTECEHGRMVNSGFLNGMEVAEAKKAIADYLEKEGIGHRKVNYKLREHPLAKAILAAAEQRSITVPDAEGFKASAGHGVDCTVNGTHIVMGSARLMREQGIANPLEEKAAALSADGKTPIYMAADGKLTALFAVADAIKPDAVEAIRLLKEMNVKLVMLTGDNSLTAKAVAAKVGIDEVRSEVLPGDKAGEVARLQGMGYTVAMVGDGVNDAPALVKADTGIAIGAGADVAIESADIVLMGGELGGVAAALRLSRAAMTNIKENLFWAFGYNTLGIPVAAGVLHAFGGPLLSPMIAAAAMSLSSVSVVTNALRLRRFDPNKTHKYLKPHSSKKNGGNDAAQAGNNNNITSKEETNMITLKVNGMMCQHCQKAVEKALAEIGATHITVDLANKQATFANADEAAARKAITDAGYEVE